MQTKQHTSAITVRAPYSNVMSGRLSTSASVAQPDSRSLMASIVSSISHVIAGSDFKKLNHHCDMYTRALLRSIRFRGEIMHNKDSLSEWTIALPQATLRFVASELNSPRVVDHVSQFVAFRSANASDSTSLQMSEAHPTNSIVCPSHERSCTNRCIPAAKSFFCTHYTSSNWVSALAHIDRRFELLATCIALIHTKRIVAVCASLNCRITNRTNAQLVRN